jgi:hypothetical protein
MMITAIDSTFGKCCPCWKDKEKKTKKYNTETITDHIDNKNSDGKVTTSDDNLEKLIANYNLNGPNTAGNDDKEKVINPMNDNSESKTLIPENKIDINAVVSDTNSLTGDERTKIINLFNFSLKNDGICKNCVQNTAAENKIVLVYDVSKKNNGKGYNLKSVSLKFGYCEKHTTNAKCVFDDCVNNACYITWCGHQFCKECLEKQAGKKNVFGVCDKCKAVFCGFFQTELFSTHIWCNDPNNGHYVCYYKNPDDSPIRQKNGWNPDTWVCSEHQLNK